MLDATSNWLLPELPVIVRGLPAKLAATWLEKLAQDNLRVCSRDRGYKAIPVRRHRFNHRGAFGSSIEGLPQAGDMDGEVHFLHEFAAPRAIDRPW